MKYYPISLITRWNLVKWIAPGILLLIFTANAETTIQVANKDLMNNVLSGVIGDSMLAEPDWAFGTIEAQTAADGDQVRAGSLIGDNGFDYKLGQMWCFNATPELITDLNNGYSIQLEFTSGTFDMLNNGGAPGSIAVYFLGSGFDLSRSDAAGSSPTEIGTVSGSDIESFHRVTMSDTSTLTGLLDGDRIWFGLDGGLSINGLPNNIKITGEGAGGEVEATLLTAIPEPSAFGLYSALVSFGWLGFCRQRARHLCGARL